MLNMWQQLYDPLNNIWLSSAVALIPIIFFFLALAVFRLKGSIAGTGTVIIALLIALFFYQMPGQMAFASIIYGFFYGLWPISWIIIGAVFLYKISVKQASLKLSAQAFYLLPKTNVCKCYSLVLHLVLFLKGLRVLCSCRNYRCIACRFRV